MAISWAGIIKWLIFRRIKQCKCTVTFEGFPFNKNAAWSWGWILHSPRLPKPWRSFGARFLGFSPRHTSLRFGRLPETPFHRNEGSLPYTSPSATVGNMATWRDTLKLETCGWWLWAWGCHKKWYKKWCHPRKNHMLTLKNRDFFWEGWNDLLVLNYLLHPKNVQISGKKGLLSKGKVLSSKQSFATMAFLGWWFLSCRGCSPFGLRLFQRTFSTHPYTFTKKLERDSFHNCLGRLCVVCSRVGLMGYNLLVNGVYWGYNLLILAFY